MFKTLFHHLAMVQCDPSSHSKMVLPISDWKSLGGGSLHAIGKMMNCPMQDKSGHVAGKHICRKHPLHVASFASGFVSSIFLWPSKNPQKTCKENVDWQLCFVHIFCALLICHFLCFCLSFRWFAPFSKEVALSLFLSKILIFSNCRNLWIKHDLW